MKILKKKRMKAKEGMTLILPKETNQVLMRRVRQAHDEIKEMKKEELEKRKHLNIE